MSRMNRMARLLADCQTPICLLWRAGYAMLMSPNKDETAVHSCRKTGHTAELVMCASVHDLVCIFA